MKAMFIVISRRFGLRLISTLLLGSFLLAYGQVVPVEAATYFLHLGMPVLPPSNCTSTSNYVQGTATLNVLAGMTKTIVPILDGTPLTTIFQTYPTAKSGQGPYWGFISGFYQKTTYNFAWVYTLKSKSGTLLSRATVSFTCINGVMTNIRVTNIDFGSDAVPNFTDGRCNQEPWQSVAVYPDNKGGYNFYAIYQGVGALALNVTRQQLDANPDKGVNYLLAQNMGVQLFRLAGGLLQVHRLDASGKDYSYNLDMCPSLINPTGKGSVSGAG